MSYVEQYQPYPYGRSFYQRVKNWLQNMDNYNFKPLWEGRFIKTFLKLPACWNMQYFYIWFLLLELNFFHFYIMYFKCIMRHLLDYYQLCIKYLTISILHWGNSVALNFYTMGCLILNNFNLSNCSCINYSTCCIHKQNFHFWRICNDNI